MELIASSQASPFSFLPWHWRALQTFLNTHAKPRVEPPTLPTPQHASHRSLARPCQRWLLHSHPFSPPAISCTAIRLPSTMGLCNPHPAPRIPSPSACYFVLFWSHCGISILCELNGAISSKLVKASSCLRHPTNRYRLPEFALPWWPPAFPRWFSSSLPQSSAVLLLPSSPQPLLHLQLPPQHFQFPLPVPHVKVAPLPAPSSTAWLVNVHPAAQLDSSMLGTDTDIKAHKFKPDPVGFVWTQLFADTHRLAKVGVGGFSSFFPTLLLEAMRRYNPEKKAKPPSPSAKLLPLNLGTAGSSPEEKEQLLTCGKTGIFFPPNLVLRNGWTIFPEFNSMQPETDVQYGKWIKQQSCTTWNRWKVHRTFSLCENTLF